MGVERMKDPLCDARASQAFSVIGGGSTHSSGLSKHKASKRGGNATEVTMGGNKTLSAVSYRYMRRKRGLDSGEWRWPSFSTIMCKRSVSSSWTGNCHAFMVLHAELTLSQRGITAPPSIRDIDMANKFDAASMFA